MPDSIYNTPEWRRARAEALARDDGRCTAVEYYDVVVDDDGTPEEVPVRCDETESLHVHHVTQPELGGDAYDLANLLTLCAAHHGRLHGIQRQVERMLWDDELLVDSA